MNILLTGGRGMVGRNILEHQGCAAHNFAAPTRAELDLRDREAVRRYVAALRPDLIIHAAGKVGGIQANIADPVAFLAENLSIGINVVEAAIEAGTPRFLNIASSCIYPKDHEGTLREDMILGGYPEPTNEGYALAKISILRLCQYVSRTHPALAYKSIIPCNLYGRFDNFDPVSSHLLPSIVHKVSEARRLGQDKIEIWGDGSARREFMYASDLADFILQAIPRFDGLPDIMNVGVGQDHSILQYYETAARVLGWTGEFTFDLTKPAGMKAKLLEVSRQREFGWMPATSIEQGIELAHDFYLRERVS